MLHQVLKIPQSLAPCKGKSSLSHFSFDELISLIFSLINFIGKVPSEYHKKYLKLCNYTKEKSVTKKWAAHDKVLCVSETQSNAICSLASSKKSHRMSIQTSMEHISQTDI